MPQWVGRQRLEDLVIEGSAAPDHRLSRSQIHVGGVWWCTGLAVTMSRETVNITTMPSQRLPCFNRSRRPPRSNAGAHPAWLGEVQVEEGELLLVRVEAAW